MNASRVDLVAADVIGVVPTAVLTSLPNQYGGLDLRLAGGTVIRLADEHDDGAVEVHVFTNSQAMVLRYSIRFDAPVPQGAVVAAVVALVVRETVGDFGGLDAAVVVGALT